MTTSEEKLLQRDLDGVTIHAYEDRRLPIAGVGPNHIPYVDMESYLDTSQFDVFHDEVNVALSQIWDYNFPNANGTIPEELRWFPEQTHPMRLLYNVEQYDPTGRHRANLAKLKTKVEKIKYASIAMGAVQMWYYSLFLIYNEHHLGHPFKPEFSKPTKHAKLFPETMEFFTKGLPFDFVSRVIILTTFPGAEVICHRDIIQKHNLDHHIIFNFGGGRKSYMYDCETREKIYNRRDCRAWFFNDQDYHGVDAVPNFEYTIRVDGEFTDEFCDSLGLVDKKISGY